MRIEMTPTGIGQAVQDLLKDGLPLPEAYERVAAHVRDHASELAGSELVEWLVRRAEQDLWHRQRPLAVTNGAEEGQHSLGNQGPHAPPARSYFDANPLDFQFYVPGVGRKRLGALTVSEWMKVHSRWHTAGRTLIKKARQAKEIYEAMAVAGVETLDDLGLKRGAPLLAGLT